MIIGDYYKILEVKTDCTPEDIKKSFHRLAHIHHPDKKTGNEAKFKEINEAYQYLSKNHRPYKSFNDTVKKIIDDDNFGMPFNGTTSYHYTPYTTANPFEGMNYQDIMVKRMQEFNETLRKQNMDRIKNLEQMMRSQAEQKTQSFNRNAKPPWY